MVSSRLIGATSAMLSARAPAEQTGGEGRRSRSFLQRCISAESGRHTPFPHRYRHRHAVNMAIHDEAFN